MPAKNTVAQARYDSQHTRRVEFKFNRRTDADILQKLDSCQNIQAYLKALIRQDIGQNPEKEEPHHGHTGV